MDRWSNEENRVSFPFLQPSQFRPPEELEVVYSQQHLQQEKGNLCGDSIGNPTWGQGVWSIIFQVPNLANLTIFMLFGFTHDQFCMFFWTGHDWVKKKYEPVISDRGVSLWLGHLHHLFWTRHAESMALLMIVLLLRPKSRSLMFLREKL